MSRSGSERRILQSKITLRLNDDLHEAIFEEAKLLGLTPGGLAREILSKRFDLEPEMSRRSRKMSVQKKAVDDNKAVLETIRLLEAMIHQFHLLAKRIAQIKSGKPVSQTEIDTLAANLIEIRNNQTAFKSLLMDQIKSSKSSEGQE